MAGTEAEAAAAATAETAAELSQHQQQQLQQQQKRLGKVGDASQLVEAALQATIVASQDQRFATTKTLFMALSSLCAALRLELRLKNLGQVWMTLYWGLMPGE